MIYKNMKNFLFQFRCRSVETFLIVGVESISDWVKPTLVFLTASSLKGSEKVMKEFNKVVNW
jgi:hypothetical protein